MNKHSSSMPMTLNDVNKLLRDAGFPKLTPAQARHLVTMEPRDHIVNHAQLAKREQNSRGWLRSLLQRAGVVASAVPAATGQSTPVTTQAVVVQRSSAPQVPGRSYMDGQGASRAMRPTSVAQPPVVAVEAGVPTDHAPVTPYSEADGSDARNADRRKQWHVYAGKAALCFEADTTRSGEPTVALDAATSVGARMYDWKNKVRLQLSLRELPVVAAVLLGKLNGCEYGAHGEGNSKGFSIEFQPQQAGGGTYFIKVWSKGQPTRAVPMDAADAYYVSALIMEQLAKQNTDLSPPERNLLLDRLARIHKCVTRNNASPADVAA